MSVEKQTIHVNRKMLNSFADIASDGYGQVAGVQFYPASDENRYDEVIATDRAVIVHSKVYHPKDENMPEFSESFAVDGMSLMEIEKKLPKNDSRQFHKDESLSSVKIENQFLDSTITVAHHKKGEKSEVSTTVVSSIKKSSFLKVIPDTSKMKHIRVNPRKLINMLQAVVDGCWHESELMSEPEAIDLFFPMTGEGDSIVVKASNDDCSKETTGMILGIEKVKK